MTVNRPEAIAFCGGGTGGHVYPLIGLIQQLNAEKTVFFMAAERFSAPSEWANLAAIDVIQLPERCRTFRQLIHSIYLILRPFRQYRVRWLIVSGGRFAFLPAILAKCCGVSLILIEPNAIPGRVNRVLGRFSQSVFAMFPASRTYFKRQAWHHVSFPIRTGQASMPVELTRLRVSQQHHIMGVLGGSQGAQAINRLVFDQRQRWYEHGIAVVHIWGERDFRKQFPNQTVYIEQDPAKPEQPYYVALPYCHEMNWFYQHITVLLARSGAGTLMEALAFKRPCILVPYPYAKDNHQRANAIDYQSMGEAVVCEQATLTVDQIITAIMQFTETQSNSAQQPKAAVTVLKTLLDVGTEDRT